MTSAEIKVTQAKVGATPDGFWGPKSIKACQKHLRSLMPNPHPFPMVTGVRGFFGEPGDESNLVNLPSPVALYYERKRVNTIRCHKKISDALRRALIEAYAAAPEIVSIYDGCYNYRKMRGGTSFSMHAWGIAIDLDADHNRNKVSWPVAARMPLSVMEAFARHGFLSAGAFWGRDAMHMQATQ